MASVRRRRRRTYAPHLSGSEKRRQRTKELRAERQAAGLCIHCPEPAMPGFCMCANHYAADGRNRRDKKAAGKCNNCGEMAVSGKRYCAKHLQAVLTTDAARQKSRAEAGLCAYYGCDNARPPKGRLCEECRRKARERLAALRAKRAAAGLCQRCGKEPAIAGNSLGETCWFRTMSHDVLGSCRDADAIKAMLVAQGGQCTYSGLPILPGVNASLDHRVPFSKGGADSLDNLQWVHAAVNQMKHSFTEEEFLSFVHAIAAHRPP